MWLRKPLYEGLPFCYLALGFVLLAAALWFGDGSWPVVCAGFGLASITLGLVLWLKRRDYRSSRSRTSFEKIR